MAFLFLPHKKVQSHIKEYFSAGWQHRSQFGTALMSELLTRLDPAEREQRRERGREDIAWWLKTYLPHYFRSPFSQTHYEIFRLFRIKGRLVVIVTPRDSGKGTTLFGLTLHGMAYDLLPFPTRVEYNFDIANQEMMKFVDTVTNNPRFLADYSLRPGYPWRPSSGLLTLNNGRQLRYIGMDQVARGTVSLNFRIDPLIANDLESLTSVRSPTQTQKLFDFMTKDVAHAGQALSEGGHTYIYVGTKISQNCATQRMIDSPLAEAYEFPAMIGDMDVIKEFLHVISSDAGNMREYLRGIESERSGLPQGERNATSGERQRYVLESSEFAPYLSQITSYWPERFPVYDLVFEAAKSTDAFMQEMLHAPGDAKFQKFYDQWFQEFPGTLSNDGDYVFGMGIDTSGEPREGSDPMAIVAGAYDRRFDRFFILDFWCHQATPEELVFEAAEMFDRCFRRYDRDATVFLEAIVSATGMGKSFFAATLRANNKPTMTVKEVRQTENKELRIAAMRPHAEQRKIFVTREHGQQGLLIKQWCNWTGESTHKSLPVEYKIDGPDAMTLLYSQLTRRRKKREGRDRDQVGSEKYSSTWH